MTLGTSQKIRIDRIRKGLRNTLPADVWRRAEKILLHDSVNHPEDGAIALLTKANNGKEYPGVHNAIALCAGCNGPPLELPPIIVEKKVQRKYARVARDLLAQVEQYSRFCGGRYGFQAPLRNLWGEVSASDIPDPLIVQSLQMVAKVFGMMADIPRKVGRPDDVRVRNVLCLLEDQFRLDFGKPHYGIIGRFWEAAFPDAVEKDAETVRVTISNYRKS